MVFTDTKLKKYILCGSFVNKSSILFNTARHNEVRDIVAGWMSEIYNNEPTLPPISGKTLSHTSAISEDGARLDIAAYGFWGSSYERAFFDVCVSLKFQPLAATYRKHEK